MPEKILFFCGGTYVAGMEIITLVLMKGLKQQGFDVRCVVNGWNDGDFKKRLTEADIPFYEVKLGWIYWRKPAWTLGTLVNYPAAYRVCKKAIKEFNPGILHFTNYGIPVMLYPLVKGNTFYTLHDTQLPNRKHRVIYRLLNKKIKHFVAVSSHIAATLSNLAIPGKKISTIYNGVMLPAGKVQAKRTADAYLVFGIIGQVSAAKGHGVLLDAVAHLVKKNIAGFSVVIIGNDDNDYSRTLKKLMEEKNIASFFTWRGFVKNTDEIYRDIDVVVVPSLCTEAFSLTTAEAMIRGLVAITSNSGGMKELIDHEQSGLLFPQGDALALSDCMAMLINDRHQLSIMGENAKQKATVQFTDVRMVQKYIELYQEKAGPRLSL